MHQEEKSVVAKWTAVQLEEFSFVPDSMQYFIIDSRFIMLLWVYNGLQWEHCMQQPRANNCNGAGNGKTPCTVRIGEGALRLHDKKSDVSAGKWNLTLLLHLHYPCSVSNFNAEGKDF